MKKAMTMVLTMGIIIVISTLALASLYFTTQESRIAEHKVKRIQAQAAAQAGIIYALERLRKGDDPADITALSVGDAADQGYPISVTLKIGEEISGTDTILDGTRPVNATVNY
ncbi:MAG: hypothetical protein KKH93_05565 [Candidatus Omnitrophica bacterium]|nr:hypothetical protein [Candidatus Omnitrophota bacterium]MBU2044164.1 hypothetical protein [Candidatus Omnitrophota bacterium]